MDKGSFFEKVSQFVKDEIEPFANQYAIESRLPQEFIQRLAQLRLLGTLIKAEYGGYQFSYKDYGKLTWLIGKACSSVRSLLTVHDMVSSVIQQFGSLQQKNTWLPSLATGQKIAAFALSETGIGSQFEHIQTHLTERKGQWILKGKKVWISFGQIADLFLIFAKLDHKAPIALLVPSDTPGLLIKPIDNALGKSASMLAEIELNEVIIEPDQFLGAPGTGLNFVATKALTLGRYSVAYGCLGIIDACLSIVKKQVLKTRVDGNKLIQYPLVNRLMTEMLTARKTTALLCQHAALGLDERAMNALENVMIAKYSAAQAASRVANDALHLAGAEGFCAKSPLRRYLHDAKVCELIEGSNEIMQLTISQSFLGTYQYHECFESI